LRARLKRAGEAPGELAWRLSGPFQHRSPTIPAPIRPLACMKKEFRILLSAILRIISPAGKSIFLSIVEKRPASDLGLYVLKGTYYPALEFLGRAEDLEFRAVFLVPIRTKCEVHLVLPLFASPGYL
jgi:hypothetical protein